MAQFLDLFDREILDEEGEPIFVNKTDQVFYERIAGILPMFVKDMSSQQVIRCLEVMVARNVGSDRLFQHYILHHIERHVLKFSVDLYSRMIRALA
jgi:hypothetical protein